LKPHREHATHNQQTYFVSSQTWQRRLLFRKERWAKLFLETLYHYRQSAYLLHEFVLMPDHFHLLITPKLSLERAVQYIKGGFSYRAKHELRSNLEVWQQGFTDHRVRCWADYVNHVRYIYDNPLEKGLVTSAQDYPYSSIRAEFEKDAVPQRLKPEPYEVSNGTAEAVPLQNEHPQGRRSDASSDENVRSQAAVSDSHRADRRYWRKRNPSGSSPLATSAKKHSMCCASAAISWKYFPDRKRLPRKSSSKKCAAALTD